MWTCRVMGLSLVSAAAWAYPGSGSPQPGNPVVIAPSGRLIAKPKPGARLAARAALSIIRDDADVGEWIVRVTGHETDDEASRRLMRTGQFEYVHPDWIVAPAIEPNDPLYPSQWHLPRLNLPAAWDLTTGSTNVIVAVCDSGIDLDHPDMASVLVPGYNAVDNLDQVGGGLVGPTNDHGTAAAGCACAVGNNGVGVAGAGWNLRLMPVRVSNLASGNAFLSDINRGARWAVDHGAGVVNISYSGVSAPTNSTTGAYLKARGASCVWAAGNANAVAAGIDLTDLVVVGATTSSNTRASFSNFGPAIDVVAPGVWILMPKVDGWATNDGTSFAAPLVAGVLGLIRSANPGWGPVEAEFALRLTSLDLGAPGRDDTFGYGLVDAGRAVRLAVDARSIPMAPTAVADAASGFSGEVLELDVLANDIDLNGDTLGLVVAHPQTPAGPASVVSGPGGRPIVRVHVGGAFTGVFSIPYSAVDPGGLASSSTVSVAIARRPRLVPQPPVLIPDVFGDIKRLRAADLDGDGDLDLLAGTLSTLNSITLLRNDAGVFTVVGSLSLPTNGNVFDVADLNRDGQPDIVSTSWITGQIAVCVSTGTFTFSAPTLLAATAPGDVVITTEAGAPLDVNGDGFTDCIVANQTASTAELRLGDGLGGFQAPIRAGFLGIGPVAIRAADMNDDGRPDIVAVSNGNVAITALLATGSTSFGSARFSSLPVTPSDLLVLNADGVGPTDVAVLSQGLLGDPPGVWLMKSRGAGPSVVGLFDPHAFLPAVDPVGLIGGDFNADALGDLAVPLGADRQLAVLPATARSESGGLGVSIGSVAARSPSGLLQVSSLRAAQLLGSAQTDLVVGGTAIGPLGVRGAVEIWTNGSRPDCVADFDGDGQSDGFDYDLFVACFEGAACVPGRSADIDADGFVDAFDYEAFVALFEAGCPA